MDCCSAYGCSHVPPVQAGADVLFVQEKGSRVRSLRFDAIQDQYQSFDMSVLSSHLLSEVELVCDRVTIVNHGRVVAKYIQAINAARTPGSRFCSAVASAIC